MREHEQPARDLDDVLDEVQTNAHERFRLKPGTAAHQEAIDREIALDHELDDVIHHEAADTGANLGGR